MTDYSAQGAKPWIPLKNENREIRKQTNKNQQRNARRKIKQFLFHSRSKSSASSKVCSEAVDETDSPALGQNN